MAIQVSLIGGHGDQTNVNVSPDGRAYVQEAGVPPYGTHNETRVYRDYFENSLGSNDMRVDGSVTNQDFYIKADQENDRYIKTVSLVIADDGAKLSKFGAITALTNGVQMFYEDESGIVEIHEGLKTNWDLVRLAGGQPAFGTGADVFKGKDIEGKVDAYIPVINLSEVFGLTYGIRLKAKSTQQIVFRIRDNITAIDSFNAIAYGFDRLKE